MLFLARAPAWQLGVAASRRRSWRCRCCPTCSTATSDRRLEIFLDPTQDPLGAGYNLLQARIAVGAGGLFGQGWLHGLQGQLGFVPERATDFVFAIFAEEFGLLGSLVLLAIFGVLLIRLLRAAAVAPDRFGELLAGGVFVMIFVQVVENVGMNIGVLPIAGIPLPLISYGGSATITTLAALGLVQSVDAAPPGRLAPRPPCGRAASSRSRLAIPNSSWYNHSPCPSLIVRCRPSSSAAESSTAWLPATRSWSTASSPSPVRR